MCLTTITKQYDKPQSPVKWQRGYKVLDVSLGKIQFPHQPLIIKTKELTTAKYDIELNKVYTSTIRWEMRIGPGLGYTPGFHIFPVRMAAKLYTAVNQNIRRIFEVQYRRVTCEGTHGVLTNYPVDCVIAHQMRVLRELTADEVRELDQDDSKINRTDRPTKRRR
jgi:hypothetical protein